MYGVGVGNGVGVGVEVGDGAVIGNGGAQGKTGGREGGGSSVEAWGCRWVRAGLGGCLGEWVLGRVGVAATVESQLQAGTCSKVAETSMS